MTNKNNKNSIDLLSQNNALKSQLEANTIISEITRVMISNKNLDDVLNTMMLGIQEILGFDRVILFRIDPEAFILYPEIWLGVDDNIAKGLTIPLSFMDGGDLADAIFLNRHIIVDEVTDDYLKDLNSKSYLAIPFITKISNHCKDTNNCNNDKCPAYNNPNPYCWSIPGTGTKKNIDEDTKRKKCVSCPSFGSNYLLWLDKTSDDELVTSSDMSILTTLASQAGIIIDNFRTTQELNKANSELKIINQEIKKMNLELKTVNLLIQKDLEQAKTIQEGLLPESLIQNDIISAAATYVPADQVGGDYYDLFEITPGIYAITVADVSGHGVSASLIMSMVKILLKIYANSKSASQTLQAINKTFIENIKAENFVTMFHAILNTNTMELTYSSAGHCPMILQHRTNNTIELLKAEGIFVGIFDDIMTHDTVVKISSNDRLVLYTDGLTEADNQQEDMYSQETLEELVKNTSKLNTVDFQDELIKSLHSFIGLAPLKDDVTTLIVDIK